MARAIYFQPSKLLESFQSRIEISAMIMKAFAAESRIDPIISGSSDSSIPDLLDQGLNMENHNVVIDIEADSPKPDRSKISKHGQSKPANHESFSKSLTASIENRLSTLPRSFDRVCIYRISEKRRIAYEEAYTPRLVSIGPLHHGRSQLQAMHIYKLRCLQNFLARTELDLERLVKLAKEMEYLIRACYEDPMEQISNEIFVEMILLDSVFTIELFFKNYYVKMRGRDDTIFDNRWMLSDIMHDMLLLENQLPMDFTLKVFGMMPEDPEYPSSFLELAREYFNKVGNTRKLQMLENRGFSAKHLVDFLIYLHCPSVPRDEPSTDQKFEYTRGAAELLAAGVKFVHGNENCLFDVKFDKGQLIIPQLTVNELTETFFRNLIAYEQSGYFEKHITSYVILMDSLINTGEDVDLLVDKKIIVNDLGESELVADLFNNLYKEVIEDTTNFYFAKLCADLNEYSKDYWHEWKSTWFKWKNILRRDYFGNPWSFISVIAAVILLVLTVIQTVCSLLQVI